MENRNIDARELAAGFLLPIAPRPSVQRIAKRLLEAASNDERIASQFDAIQKKLGDGIPIIGDEHSEILECIKSPGLIPNIPTAPEWLRPLLAVAYLRAKIDISSGKATHIFRDLELTLSKIVKSLDSVEQSFIGELLIDTVLAARDDSQFTQFLEEGATEFRALVDELYGSKDGSHMLARAGSNLGGDGSCEACRTIGGLRRCEPISC